METTPERGDAGSGAAERTPGKTDISVSMEQANIYSLLFAAPFIVVFSAAFLGLWGVPAFWVGFQQMGRNLLVFLLAFIGGIVLHEGIHALSWAFFGKKPLAAIHFGIMWSTISPYAHCTVPLEINAYRMGTLMPGLLLGIVPALAGILTGIGWLVIFGILFTTAACGDALILWLIRKVPSGKLVEDHPTRAGCYILE